MDKYIMKRPYVNDLGLKYMVRCVPSPRFCLSLPSPQFYRVDVLDLSYLGCFRGDKVDLILR